MSQLHRDIIEKYRSYYLGFKLVELDRNHYMFHLISNNNVLISGTGIPIATYDLQKNALIWSDSSNTLDKGIVKDVRDIRNKNAERFNQLTKDYSVMTRNEIDRLFFDISETLRQEILMDETPESIHIYLVKKILTDDR